MFVFIPPFPLRSMPSMLRLTREGLSSPVPLLVFFLKYCVSLTTLGNFPSGEVRTRNLKSQRVTRLATEPPGPLCYVGKYRVELVGPILSMALFLRSASCVAVKCETSGPCNIWATLPAPFSLKNNEIRLGAYGRVVRFFLAGILRVLRRWQKRFR
ncbi:unnamed protein product [Ectocarpus sp. 12 AP-2014]